MKKHLALAIILTCLIVLLTGCGCEHEWSEASCQAPKTCISCGETEGEAISHNFGEATCAAPSTCSVCGATQGAALNHTLTEANFQEAARCTVCGAAVGAPLTPGFVELQINAHYVELGEPTMLTINGVRYTYTVLSHTTSEAEDGYIWHTIKEQLSFKDGQLHFYDEDYSYTDFSDYYTPIEQTASVAVAESDALMCMSFTVNYMGQEYTECMIRVEDHTADSIVDEADFVEASTTEIITSFRIPEGYDGILMAMGDACLMEGGSYDALWPGFYNNENTAVYRIQ